MTLKWFAVTLVGSIAATATAGPLIGFLVWVASGGLYYLETLRSEQQAQRERLEWLTEQEMRRNFPDSE